MPTPQSDLHLIRMLSDRLERISADSIWAHRASGVRGALLSILDDSKKDNVFDQKTISNLLAVAFHILEQAAKRS